MEAGIKPQDLPKGRARSTLRLATLAGLLGIATACGGSEEATGAGESQAAVRIVPHIVRHERQETRVEAVGTARALTTATIFPETSGEVTEVLFTANELVQRGDPLIRLESREEALAVRLAQVSVREAEQLLERYRRIEGTGAISASQIDEARTALDAAQIELEQAQVALADRTIRAPFEGHVGITNVDPGERVTSTTEITRVDDRSKLLVDFAPPEQVFGQIAIGDVVVAQPFAEGRGDATARIAAIDSRIDPDRRTFLVRAEIENTDDQLRPGMSFRVSFSIPGTAYPSLPEASIVWGSDGSYVWRDVEGAVERVPVTIISREQGTVLVSGDLPPGSRIVAQGVQKVRAGSRVLAVGEENAEQPAARGAQGGAE